MNIKLHTYKFKWLVWKSSLKTKSAVDLLVGIPCKGQLYSKAIKFIADDDDDEEEVQEEEGNPTSGFCSFVNIIGLRLTPS